MNTEKFLKYVLVSLDNDLLRTELLLEEALNSPLSLKEKTVKIKSELEKMVLIEASIFKFNAMITNNNKEEEK